MLHLALFLHQQVTASPSFADHILMVLGTVGTRSYQREMLIQHVVGMIPVDEALPEAGATRQTNMLDPGNVSCNSACCEMDLYVDPLPWVQAHIQFDDMLHHALSTCNPPPAPPPPPAHQNGDGDHDEWFAFNSTDSNTTMHMPPLQYAHCYVEKHIPLPLHWLMREAAPIVAAPPKYVICFALIWVSLTILCCLVGGADSHWI
jgi:hypothetical protein